MNRLFVLSFEDDAVITGHTGYFLPNVEIKHCNVRINGRNLFDQPIRNDIEANKKSLKNCHWSKDDYTTDCLLGYRSFKENYVLITTILTKLKIIDANPKEYNNIILREIWIRLEIQHCVLFIRK